MALVMNDFGDEGNGDGVQRKTGCCGEMGMHAGWREARLSDAVVMSGWCLMMMMLVSDDKCSW